MQNQENNLQIQIHSKINNPFITYDLKWVPSSTRFLSIGGTGENQGIITVYSLERNQRISIQKKIEGEYNFKCGTFGASDKIDRNISVGDFQGDLKIFDLEYSEEPLFKSSHLSMINSIDGILYNNSPFIAASLQNGNIVCLDPRQQKTIMEFHDNLNIDAWCVKINDQNNPVILTGYENGDFLAVDIRKPTKSNNLKFNLNHPICSIDVKNKNHILNIACSCTENSMIFFDLDLQKDFEEKTKNPLNYQKLDFNKYFNEKNDEKNSEKKNVKNFEEKNSEIDSENSVTLWSTSFSPFNPNLLGISNGIGDFFLMEHRNSKVDLVSSLKVPGKAINCFDWSFDKAGLFAFSCFDENLYVGICGPEDFLLNF